jgi:hypothetical protein
VAGYLATVRRLAPAAKAQPSIDGVLAEVEQPA